MSQASYRPVTHYTSPDNTGSPPSEYALNTLHGKYFHRSGFLSNLRLPWKQSVLWIHCIAYIFFIIQDFWATCGCHEKQSVPWINSLYWIYMFINQEFWATCACPEIFHCIETFFIIQEFRATFACLENRVCPEIFQAMRSCRPASCVNACCCLKLMGLAFKYVVEINSTS